LDDAFARLAVEELGLDWERAQSSFLGVFEHLYDDSVFGEEIDTHYVVLANHVTADLDLTALPRTQHGHYAWRDKASVAGDARVHPNTRAYARAIAGVE